jgi:hypothetical protein
LLALRHGPHQLAQKSISTTFPFSDDSFTVLPVVSFKVISGTLVDVLFWANNVVAKNKVAARTNMFFI